MRKFTYSIRKNKSSRNHEKIRLRKKVFKSYAQKCTLPLVLILIIDSEIDGMVWNIKNWRSQEKSTAFSWNKEILKLCFKGALSCPRQFLATESPLKMMENAFYFTLKALFVLKRFKFLCWLFGQVEKRLDLKDKVNFKNYITTWETNNWNAHVYCIYLLTRLCCHKFWH